LSFQLCDFLLTDEALDFIHAAKVPVTVFVLKNVLSTCSPHRPACDVSIPELVGAFGQFMIVCHFMPLSSFAIALGTREIFIENRAHVLHAVTGDAGNLGVRTFGFRLRYGDLDFVIASAWRIWPISL
jgi:hypothetical protein